MGQYSIKYLYQAFNILEDRGHEAFRRYANSVNMPVEDIERVLNKYNYRQDPEFRAKIDRKIEKIKIMFEQGQSELVPF